MRNNPLCSVVMAVYNSEETLHEAIDSILNQTLKEFEFIIINDGSTDSTSALLDEYDDPRLKIFHHIRNFFSHFHQIFLRKVKKRNRTKKNISLL